MADKTGKTDKDPSGDSTARHDNSSRPKPVAPQQPGIRQPLQFPESLQPQPLSHQPRDMVGESRRLKVHQKYNHVMRDLLLFNQGASFDIHSSKHELWEWYRRQAREKAAPKPVDMEMDTDQNWTEKKRQEVLGKIVESKYLVNVCVVVFNYLGLPRSGKTTFRRRMMGEILNIMMARKMGETHQPSTGVLENGGQVFIKPSCTGMGTVRSKVWSIIKDLKEEADMLGQFFFQLSSSPPYSTSSSTSGPSGGGDENDEELISILQEALEPGNWGEVKSLLEDTILVINNDTGGHAEFLDMQAALVQGPAFNLIFSRLVDNLDSLFKISYTNEQGQSTDEEDSTITGEEVLFQSLSSIACFSGVFRKERLFYDSPPRRPCKAKVMLIGTHLDLVTEEEFKRKDSALLQKIKSTVFYKKGIVEFASPDQLMVPVDNMNGGQEEIGGIQKRLEEVINKSFSKVPIPAAWLVFSLYIRKKQFRTISMEECEEIADKLGIGPLELQDALWFLHHRLRVLLYYPEVEELKDLVICHMQVVFDSASNLIRNTFVFDKAHPSVCEKFREKGQFSLEDVRAATSGHTDSLIPLEKFIKLLEYLSILTQIPSETEGEEPTYFMPCVLKSAQASELTIESSDQDPPPLLLSYKCGYVPIGIFPSMITNLVSSQQANGWELIEEGLRKNKVQFYVGKHYDILTLISHPRYLEFSVTQNKDFEPLTEYLCDHVRCTIETTHKNVTSRMNYYFNMDHNLGFECPMHPGREHLCVFANHMQRRQCMECLQNPKKKVPIPPEKRHLVWFSTPCRNKRMNPYITKLSEATKLYEFEHHMPQCAQACLRRVLDWNHKGVDHHLNEIAKQMIDWEVKLSTLLGMTEVEIHDLKAQHSQPELLRRAVLREWKQKNGFRATYKNLLEICCHGKDFRSARVIFDVLMEKHEDCMKGYRIYNSID